MRPGQTFPIGSQEYAQPVLRTFMLLLVAGECSTTSFKQKGSAFAGPFCFVTQKFPFKVLILLNF